MERPSLTFSGMFGSRFSLSGSWLWLFERRRGLNPKPFLDLATWEGKSFLNAGFEA